MRFKKFAVILAAVFCFAQAQGLDKWNIMLANFRNLSAIKDKTTGMTIQKSVASALSKQSGFSLIQPKTNVVIDSFQTALNAGRAYKADVILYGDYFIEGEDLVLVIDVFDVLENRLKMRKYYSGAVDLDIFDTIDNMSADMMKKIREALPEMTTENQQRIRQVRQNIYETEKISIKRVFYTRVGFHTEMGPKWFGGYSSTSSFYMSPPGYQYAYSGIPVGFAFRFWELRLDLMISGLPGVPYFPWQNPDYVIDDGSTFSLDNIFLVHVSFYLPWFNNSLAISAGYFGIDIYKKILYDNNKNTMYVDRVNIPGFSMAFGLIWNVNPDLELSIMVNPFMNMTKQDINTDDAGNFVATNYQHFWRDFPAISLDAVYFLGNFGLEARLTGDPYHYREYSLHNDGTTNYSYGGQDIEVNSVIASVYLGIVYRVDFLK